MGRPLGTGNRSRGQSSCEVPLLSQLQHHAEVGDASGRVVIGLVKIDKVLAQIEPSCFFILWMDVESEKRLPLPAEFGCFRDQLANDELAFFFVAAFRYSAARSAASKSWPIPTGTVSSAAI